MNWKFIYWHVFSPPKRLNKWICLCLITNHNIALFMQHMHEKYSNSSMFPQRIKFNKNYVSIEILHIWGTLCLYIYSIKVHIKYVRCQHTKLTICCQRCFIDLSSLQKYLCEIVDCRCIFVDLNRFLRTTAMNS